ncbi:MAG: anthrone oxygenase family protein [Actinomycetota bacterium]
MGVVDILLVISVVMTGLVAGLFYGWVVSVIPGTGRLDDVEYVTLMQHINREILTPRFLVPFAGLPILLGATAVVLLVDGDDRAGWLLAVAAGVYTVGVFGVTAARNVPLNDALDEFDLEMATPDEIRRRRLTYETPWNRWNAVRTVANIAALALVAAAAVSAA